MLRRAAILSALILSVPALLGLLLFLPIRESEIASFKAEHMQKLKKDTKRRPFHQVRQDVRKDIYLAESDGRRQMRIESDTSFLTLLPINGREELVEELKGIRCYMQDKLVYHGDTPVQQMRYFQSESGRYHFNSHLFTADTVNMTLYQAPGWILDCNIDQEKTFLRGVASEVTFSFKQGSPHFHANQFKAHVSPLISDAY